MISAALMLFANTLLFSLRLDRSGSFPRPLSASEEIPFFSQHTGQHPIYTGAAGQQCGRTVPK